MIELGREVSQKLHILKRNGLSAGNLSGFYKATPHTTQPLDFSVYAQYRRGGFQ